jgi:sodium pump decarboxylase gamma subunit
MAILKTALIHTLLGMGTVFVILILISLIISLFKFIPMIQEKFSKKKPEPAAAPAPAAPVVEEVEEETDDLELVAVITAAVAVAMGTTSTDGFVVRSIKRTGANHWKR